ncbi:MAG: VTT domain-containing protein [Verrucomicrobiota bacterium]
MTEILPLAPHAVAGWMPLWEALGIFLATFVLEDIAAVGAGLLLANHSISWTAAFTACFLGIWLGDGGLYALARFGGRKWFERSSLKRFSSKVLHCEEWFAERGVYVLIFSRCVPGARLPTYLAAGFLRLPLLKFLTVTGAAAFVWALVILWLAESLGAQLVQWLNAYKHGSLIFLGLGAALFFFFQLLRRTDTSVDLRQVMVKLERWRHWEFWPPWMFYPPVALYCVWLAIKYRGLTVVTASNPGILSGGLVGESKMVTLKTLAQTSPHFTATAGLVAAGDWETRLRAVEEIRAHLHLQFPFILKPDVGQRGAGVKLIRTQAQAEHYLRQTAAPLLVQRYAPGPFEAGIFYYRFPHEPHGKIFAITDKIFPVVVGDGQHTIAELIDRDARARFIADIYFKRLAPRRNEVLPAGESVRLVEAGNHAQGCIFRDGQRLWSPQLEARVDEISQKLDEFYIGRYDIRYPDENDLRAGRNFQIVELNGASSEATHIYDARNSLRSAYKTLFHQWDLVFAIGAANRRRGFSPTKLSVIWNQWRGYSRLAATYPEAD